MPTDLQTLNVILQGGSFGLVAWAVVYAIRTLAPRILSAHEKSQEKFDAILERQEKRHDDEKKRRDDAFERVTDGLKQVVSTLGGVVNALNDVTDRLERVEAKTDEFRAPAAPPRRRQPHPESE